MRAGKGGEFSFSEHRVRPHAATFIFKDNGPL
jgi:hypothetical protein